MELKDNLQFLRKQNGYSQEELADRIGIARQTVSKWENGQAVPELGGECFAGEEAVWYRETPVWSMNYAGRVTGEHFSGDFLKEALMRVPEEKPFRGPEIYGKGDYHYHCSVTGEFAWFQGYEEIFYEEWKIYECHFHGGTLR